MGRRRRSRPGQIATVVACTVGALNLGLSVLALVQSVPFLQAIAMSDLSVSIEILTVLGLQCMGDHAIGLLTARVWRTASGVTSLLFAALLALASSWIALFNIQVLLAPTFTFTVGPVVMTNPYIAVVLTYMACALVSFGFIFLNVRLARLADVGRLNPDGGLSAEEFSMLASGAQGLMFVALGMMAGI